jgi:hypothetical protein
MIKGIISTMRLGFVALILLAAFQATTRADEVTIAGSTTGVVTGVPPLTFTGNVFTGTTALGIGALSGNNRLGTFTLSTAPLSLESGSFTLNITFTAPVGITGGQTTSFSATLSGSVSPNVDQGGVTIDFTNPTQVFTFSNGSAVGSFSLTVADLFVQSGESANLTAGITGTQQAVPEPATWMLFLGGGMTGLIGRRWLRRR